MYKNYTPVYCSNCRFFSGKTAGRIRWLYCIHPTNWKSSPIEVESERAWSPTKQNKLNNCSLYLPKRTNRRGIWFRVMWKRVKRHFKLHRKFESKII